ncbi:glycosyltransferase involved in cell wall biosynthesis [Thermocatellispora tengchongensis]|uniref:Glycosyltransferase involved in cell wall biosynthesis n=1 Tax=Thermocatellispora tengchongensis TaxID=1073253 RepID=A0A840PCK1_9ACTN|nr:glycosyltransferase family 4 protein [Thermocatellispora tengchongensis]MBB5139154.1 glycosyltransferase involved in cell wall biosynthesis [Thermocatellispora tengchongensis]
MRIRYLLLHAYGMGGTIRTVINQANAMVRAGHQVELVSVVRRRDRPQFALDPRVKLSALVDQRGGVAPPSLGARMRRKLRGRMVPSGEFAIRYFTPDVEKAVIDFVGGVDDGVLVTTRPGLNLLAARFAPRRAVRVAQEHMNLATHRPDVRQAVLRHYRAFDAVVTLTETDRREYEQALPGVRVERIPNAVHKVDHPHSDQTGKIVVAAGRLFAQKGFDLLIPAFAGVVKRHRDWQLRIYGTGPKKDELRALIEEHRLYNNVFLMGRTEHFDEELRKASLFVLSSRFEGLPMVMIEAMSHALPIVSFDCPTGPADVITHGVDGLLVPPEDVAGLTAALNQLIGDRDARLRMGAAAAKTVLDYAPDAVMPRWESLFRELLSRR